MWCLAILGCECGSFLLYSVTCFPKHERNLTVIIYFSKASAGHIKCSTQHPVDPSRQLFFISDFPHLLKNIRNGFVTKGYLTPTGHVHSGIIEAAWEADCEDVTLKHQGKKRLRPPSSTSTLQFLNRQKDC